MSCLLPSLPHPSRISKRRQSEAGIASQSSCGVLEARAGIRNSSTSTERSIDWRQLGYDHFSR